MIKQYLDFLQEGYILSDKTVSVNLEKFESGENKKLLVFGPCGSGKSTLGRKLSKKYNVPLQEIDKMYWGMRYKKAEAELPRRERKEQIKAVRKKLMSMLNDNKRMIIEGVDWIDIYRKFTQFRPTMLKQSMIILGLSAWRAGIRAGKRNMQYGETIAEIPKMTKVNYKYLEKYLKIIRNDVKDIAQEYKL